MTEVPTADAVESRKIFDVAGKCCVPNVSVMSTYTQLLYHIIFATKDRQKVLDSARREDLFRYTWGIVKNINSILYRVGGVEDHVHILVGLHPTVAVADFVKTVKVASSKWIKDDKVFPHFMGWQDGYAAFTHSLAEKSVLVEYIKNQPEHHRVKTFLEEYREFVEKAGLKFDERFLP